ncbi:hypothetical protein H9P43_006133 [Blastocladiella emersonii ATCC 22665]|nr:hypothetical protein H9P43_006133 [Blastocladiella emersonii ATCC 22665]
MSFIERDKVRTAILQFTINLAGALLVGVVYLNYLLLKPYARPLFWALIFSVPLHAIKNEILAYVYDAIDDDGISVVRVFWLGLKITLKLCFGEIATLLSRLFHSYVYLVSRISADPLAESKEGARAADTTASPASGSADAAASSDGGPDGASTTTSTSPTADGAEPSGGSAVAAARRAFLRERMRKASEPLLRRRTTLTPGSMRQPRPLSMEWAADALIPLKAIVAAGEKWFDDLDGDDVATPTVASASTPSLTPTSSRSPSAATSVSLRVPDVTVAPPPPPPRSESPSPVTDDESGTATASSESTSHNHGDEEEEDEEDAAGPPSPSKSLRPFHSAADLRSLSPSPAAAARDRDSFLSTVSEASSSSRRSSASVDPGRVAALQPLAKKSIAMMRAPPKPTADEAAAGAPDAATATTPGTAAEAALDASNSTSKPSGTSASHPSLLETAPRSRRPNVKRRLFTVSRAPSTSARDRRNSASPSRGPTQAEELVAAARETSSFYLTLLWRVCSVYVVYLLYHQLGAQNQAAITLTVAGLVLVHVSFHLAIRLYLVHLRHHLRRYADLALARVHPLDVIVASVWSKVTRLTVGIGVAWVRGTFKRGKSNAKEVFARNASSFAALFVLTSVLTIGVLLTTFITFKVGQETNMVMEGTISTLESHLSDDMKQKFQSVLADGYAMGIGWVDTKLAETFPQANLTAVYRRISRSFSRSPTPTLVGLSAAASSGTPVLGKALVEDPAAVVGELAFLTRLPHTATVVAALTTGNFSALTDYTVLMGSAMELKDSSSHMVATVTKLIQDSSTATAYLSGALTSMGTVTFSVLISITQYLLDAFDFIFQGIMFLITLHTLVSRETSVTEWFAHLLILADPEQELTRSLEDNIVSVLMCTTKLTVFHTLLTWFTFSAFGVDLVYISTALTVVLSIVPLVPPMWIAVPAAISLYWQTRFWSATALLVIHFYAAWFVDPAFFAEIPEVNPYFSALAFILGLWAFGLEGLVLGPLLMTVIPTLFSMMSKKLGESEPVA